MQCKQQYWACNCIWYHWHMINVTSVFVFEGLKTESQFQMKYSIRFLVKKWNSIHLTFQQLMQNMQDGICAWPKMQLEVRLQRLSWLLRVICFHFCFTVMNLFYISIYCTLVIIQYNRIKCCEVEWYLSILKCQPDQFPSSVWMGNCKTVYEGKAIKHRTL